jgi:hypothetical protein
MLALQKQTFVGLDLQFGHERVFEHEFGPVRTATRPQGAFAGPSGERAADFHAVQAFLESTPSKKYYINLFLDYTAGIMEYDFGAGPRFPRASAAYQTYLAQALECSMPNPPAFCATLAVPGFDPGPGNQLTLQATFRFQPTSAFQTQLDINKRRLVRHDTGLVAFDDNLFSSRTTYQFNRNTFARLRLDYSTLDRRIRPQFVMGWTPNPGTALYVGYTDDINYNGFNPFTRHFEPGFQSNGRTFFIKASYLFKKSF